MRPQEPNDLILSSLCACAMSIYNTQLPLNQVASFNRPAGSEGIGATACPKLFSTSRSIETTHTGGSNVQGH
jgi:hypothetical protein